jgi:hypothetical protein
VDLLKVETSQEKLVRYQKSTDPWDDGKTYPQKARAILNTTDGR